METFIKNITLKDSVLAIQQKEPLFSNVSKSPVMSGLSQKKKKKKRAIRKYIRENPECEYNEGQMLSHGRC